MKISTFYTSAVLIAVCATAAPSTSAASIFAKRDITNVADFTECLPQSGWSGVVFSKDEVKKAGQAAVDLLKVNGKKKSSPYPKDFTDREGFFPNCPGPKHDYPIMSNRRLYDGEDPKAHRIVIHRDGDNARFCGLLTHHGAATEASFIKCQDGEPLQPPPVTCHPECECSDGPKQHCTCVCQCSDGSTKPDHGSC